MGFHPHQAGLDLPNKVYRLANRSPHGRVIEMDRLLSLLSLLVLTSPVLLAQGYNEDEIVDLPPFDPQAPVGGYQPGGPTLPELDLDDLPGAVEDFTDDFLNDLANGPALPSIPEPSILPMMVAGAVAGLLVVRRRR